MLLQARQFTPYSRQPRIPIVGITGDMVREGWVESFTQPNGNTTGISIFATELDGKRQDILIEALPGIRRMAALAETRWLAEANALRLPAMYMWAYWTEKGGFIGYGPSEDHLASLTA
jgi:putative ABC transport system substrate-binding protein